MINGKIKYFSEFLNGLWDDSFYGIVIYNPKVLKLTKLIIL